MKKKLGEKLVDNYSTPLWIQFHEFKDTMYASIYFTHSSSPRGDLWYSNIQPLGFKIISKGNWRYGYYYKVILTCEAENLQEKLNKLSEWKFVTGDGVTHSFNIKFTAEEIYTRMVMEKL